MLRQGGLATGATAFELWLFPDVRFLLRYRRQENVRWFADKYTDLVARYPKAAIGFIGDSNGTYLASSALDRYAMIRFHNIAFAGSVVPTHYDWDSKFGARVKHLRNFRSDRDLVVAIFPHLFEQLSPKGKLKAAEIGSGGFNGFESGWAKQHEVILKGGHSAGTRPEVYEALARFALDADPINIPANLVREKPAWWASLLGKFCSVVWVLLAGLLIGGGYLLVSIAGAYIAPGWLIVFYALLIALILLKI